MTFEWETGTNHFGTATTREAALAAAKSACAKACQGLEGKRDVVPILIKHEGRVVESEWWTR